MENSITVEYKLTITATSSKGKVAGFRGEKREFDIEVKREK